MELYVTIDEFKDHIHLERSYTDEDEYLTSLLEVAQSSVEKTIQQPLSDLEEEGRIAPPLFHAIRLMAANLYDHREAVGYGQLVAVPFGLNYLIKPYIKYT